MRKGQPHSDEARNKISAKMRGQPKSVETRERMQLAAIVRWNRDRNKRKMMKELTSPLNSSEDDPRPSKGLAEAFNTEGSPIAT